MNLCTDQLALTLAPRETIRSLSYLAARPDISLASDRVGDIPLNHGRSEEILPLAPTIVLAGRYTSRPTVFLLKRLGYPVLDQDISRSIADVRARVREVGRALDQVAEAEGLVAAMDARLAYLAPTPAHRGQPRSTTSPTASPPATIRWSATSSSTPAWKTWAGGSVSAAMRGCRSRGFSNSIPTS
ncbi:MAG: ABC transporter substrate-binding protein [Rhodospirillales bacterium]|nr:ABC transporter substrate-binding protein [Rhodospirillales bacterium]